MADTTELLNKALELTEENFTVQKNIKEIKVLLNQIIYNIERKYELYGISFSRLKEFKQMIQKIEEGNMIVFEILSAMDLDDKYSGELDSGIPALEYALAEYKLSLKANKIGLSNFEQTIGTAFELLMYCKKTNFLLPGGDKLAKMIEKYGYVVNGVRSTDLRHEEKSTAKETE